MPFSCVPLFALDLLSAWMYDEMRCLPLCVDSWYCLPLLSMILFIFLSLFSTVWKVLLHVMGVENFWRQKTKIHSMPSSSHLRHNVLSVMALADILRSSLGPNAHSKLIHTPNGEVVVSQDGAFILRQLRATQPAAAMLVDAVLTLDDYIGDGTTSAAILAASLVFVLFHVCVFDHPFRPKSMGSLTTVAKH